MSILLRETRGHVRILTINRPERSNAMSPELTEELIDAFVDGGADPEVRVIVLTAVGDRAFCAGADLKERKDMTDEAWVQQHLIYERMARAILVDGRNLFDPEAARQAGFDYCGIGRPQRAARANVPAIPLTV